MKSIILKGTEKKYKRLTPLYFIVSMVVSFSSCNKGEDGGILVEGITVSETESFNENVAQLSWEAEGGKDTLYVASNSAIKLSFETNEVSDWVKAEKIERIEGTDKSRIVLNILPMEGTYKKRIGVLNLSNASAYAGTFIRLSQGYNTRIEENFVWLKYGTGSPLDLTQAMPIGQWSTAQKQYGWNSTSTTTSFGMNGYIMLGTESQGALFSSPIVPGLEKDSLLLLTFDAVGYVSKEGQKDNNKLTIKLTGGEFEDGKTSKTIVLGYYDYQSALLMSNMWDKGRFSLLVKKPSLHPTTSTIQLHFLTGEHQEDGRNRVFIDNINLYILDQFKPDEKNK